MLSLCTCTGAEEGEKDTVQQATDRSRTTSRAGSRKSRPVSSKAAAMTKRKKEMRENIEASAMELLIHFNNRNLDALLRCVRNVLEALRKRITSSSMAHYIGMFPVFV
jgi:dynein heavy chain